MLPGRILHQRGPGGFLSDSHAGILRAEIAITGQPRTGRSRRINLNRRKRGKLLFKCDETRRTAMISVPASIQPIPAANKYTKRITYSCTQRDGKRPECQAAEGVTADRGIAERQIRLFLTVGKTTSAVRATAHSTHSHLAKWSRQEVLIL